MFPETEFFELGKELLLVVLNNIAYHVGNKEEIKDHNSISECNMRWVGCVFPLYEAFSLEESEKRYFEKFGEEIEKYREKFIKDQELVPYEIDKNYFLKFYFTTVLEYYKEDIEKRFGKSRLRRIEKKQEVEKKKDCITINLLAPYNGSVAIFNKRIFPLQTASKNAELDPYLTIDNKTYGIKESPMTLTKFEIKFQEELEKRIKEEVLEEISKLKEQRRELSKIEKKLVESMEKIEKARKNKFSYEFGSLGIDTEKNYIYWLNDSKDGGRNAIGTPLAKNRNGTVFFGSVSRNVMNRADRNSLFNIGHEPCIKISVPRSNDIKGVIKYLNDCAMTHYTS